MYTTTNFKNKRAIRDAIAQGQRVTVFQPGPFGGDEPKNGKVWLEGPHYPEPHRWYAEGTLKDGVLVSIK
jgi:hypothetical protein